MFSQVVLNLFTFFKNTSTCNCTSTCQIYRYYHLLSCHKKKYSYYYKYAYGTVLELVNYVTVVITDYIVFIA